MIGPNDEQNREEDYDLDTEEREGWDAGDAKMAEQIEQELEPMRLLERLG